MNIRDALNALTFEIDLDNDEMVTDAVILCRVTRMSDGRGAFVHVGNDGIDNVIKTGLIECARQINALGWEAVEDDD